MLRVGILSARERVKDFTEQLQKSADRFRNELGFLPRTAYEEMAAQGKIWIATCGAEEKFAGYLVFGGSYPTLKVFQILVLTEYRGKGIGRSLIEKLVHFGEQKGYLTIKVRVAVDLSANQFWSRLGFETVRRIQRSPGKRDLNIRVKHLGCLASAKMGHTGTWG